jgi:hypothetical protein
MCCRACCPLAEVSTQWVACVWMFSLSIDQKLDEHAWHWHTCAVLWLQPVPWQIAAAWVHTGVPVCSHVRVLWTGDTCYRVCVCAHACTCVHVLVMLHRTQSGQATAAVAATVTATKRACQVSKRGRVSVGSGDHPDMPALLLPPILMCWLFPPGSRLASQVSSYYPGSSKI